MVGKYYLYRTVYEVDSRPYALFKTEFDGIPSTELQNTATRDMEELSMEMNDDYEFSFNNRCFYVMVFYLSDTMRLIKNGSNNISIVDKMMACITAISFFSMYSTSHTRLSIVKDMIADIIKDYEIDTNPPMPEKHMDLNFKYDLSGMNFDMRVPRVEFDFFKTADHNECVEPLKEDLSKLGVDLVRDEHVTWEFPTDVVGMQIHTVVIYHLDLALKLIESSYTDLDKIKQDQEKVKKFFKFYDDMTE